MGGSAVHDIEQLDNVPNVHITLYLYPDEEIPQAFKSHPRRVQLMQIFIRHNER
jgi:hypothetical protein